MVLRDWKMLVFLPTIIFCWLQTANKLLIYCKFNFAKNVTVSPHIFLFYNWCGAWFTTWSLQWFVLQFWALIIQLIELIIFTYILPIITESRLSEQFLTTKFPQVRGGYYHRCICFLFQSFQSYYHWNTALSNTEINQLKWWLHPQHSKR